MYIYIYKYECVCVSEYATDAHVLSSPDAHYMPSVAAPKLSKVGRMPLQRRISCATAQYAAPCWANGGSSRMKVSEWNDMKL